MHIKSTHKQKTYIKRILAGLIAAGLIYLPFAAEAADAGKSTDEVNITETAEITDAADIVDVDDGTDVQNITDVVNIKDKKNSKNEKHTKDNKDTKNVSDVSNVTEAKANSDAAILHSMVFQGAHVDSDKCLGYMWRSDTAQNTGLPRQFRMMNPSFFKSPHKQGNSESYDFSCKGLESMHMSGSAEYSAEQFHNMLKEIGDKWQIYIIDLRQESHLLANGNSISWWGKHNWSNLGKDVAAVEAEEKQLATQIKGETIKVVSLNDKKGKHPASVNVQDVMTERELVESAGLKYYRLPCTDHIWPDAAQIDAFIEIYKTLPDNAWLHFHCVGGVGRTGVFMCMYDIMQNPDVKLKDIAYRQYMLGANYQLSVNDDDWMAPYKAEKNVMLTVFYEYVHECGPDGYKVSWSDWLINR